MIKAKYGAHGGLSQVGDKCGSGPWARILGAIKRLDDCGIIHRSVLKKRIGNGDTSKFWTDCWIGDQTLKTQYPRIFALETNRDCSICPAKMARRMALELETSDSWGRRDVAIFNTLELYWRISTLK